MQRIRFGAAMSTIERSAVLRLPAPASKKLPSRSQVAVRGSINGVEFETVLEPDGYFGHWMRVDDALRTRARLTLGQPAAVEVEPVDRWPEPTLPRDLKAALAAAPASVHDLWDAITPMARWEWVRWVNATANPTTRERRVEVTISKIDHGKRRPCCFDLSACTDPALAKSGKLRASGG
jgi:hypothetical protein